MHTNFETVQSGVTVPVIDVRRAVAKEVHDRGFSRLGLLGTRYVLEQKFYIAQLDFVVPNFVCF